MDNDPYLDKFISQIKVSINENEITWLRHGMEMLNQVKPSTALKQLAEIGVSKMYHDAKMFEIYKNNLRLNENRGVSDIFREVDNSLRKVPKI